MFWALVCMCVQAKSLHSCLTLWDSLGHGPPGTCVHWILQARWLEWVDIPSSGSVPDPGIQSLLLCLLHWQACSLPLVSPGKPKEYVNTKVWYKLESFKVESFNLMNSSLCFHKQTKEKKTFNLILNKWYICYILWRAKMTTNSYLKELITFLERKYENILESMILETMSLTSLFLRL